MRFKGLIEPLISDEKFNQIFLDLEKNNTIEIQGLSDSSRSYVLSAVYEKTKNSMAIITNSDMEARNLYEDLCLFNNNVYYFPVKEVVFYNIDAISGDLRWERLKVIKEL